MRLLRANRYFPRSLYGRAALILLVPVVTLQIVVSFSFIQRHFEGVTEQMTRNVALELRYLLKLIDESPSAPAARDAISSVAGPLAFRLELPSEPPARDIRPFYDFSGLVMMDTLRGEVDNVRRIDLSAEKHVRTWIGTRHGTIFAEFHRSRVSASNPHQLLVLMVLAGILLTLIAFVFLRQQLRPIKRLASASEAFGKGRIERYDPSGAAEVRAAGQAFLDMRTRTLSQIEQRTMMLLGVSHDMRTPLTRLRLGLSMVGEGQEIKDMERDVGELERLIDEFLAFARDDSLDDPELTDPVRLARDVVGKFVESGKPVRLREVSGEGTAVLLPAAVSRALENLIGNAVRYGSVCEVRIVVSPGTVRISVEDDGPGIPEGAREEALKAFVRLDPARNQDRGSGVGLGLAIASDIAHRHGGSLSLDRSLALGGLRADLVLAR